MSRYGRPRPPRAAGGYRWRDRATAMVHGLGFTDDDLDRALSTFSGGELTRASLARALAAHADVLLLDEPTNHLDIDSLEWLEQTLVGLDAAVILVAHDRWFLETVGTSVLELEAGRSRFFPGAWHAWRQASRPPASSPSGRAIDKQQAEIARMERFIDALPGGTKARQAQSRVKALGEIERIERGPARRRGAPSPSRRPSAAGVSCSSCSTARCRSGPADHCSSRPSCGSSAVSTYRSSGPTGWARRPSSRRSPGSARSPADA